MAHLTNQSLDASVKEEFQHSELDLQTEHEKTQKVIEGLRDEKERQTVAKMKQNEQKLQNFIMGRGEQEEEESSFDQKEIEQIEQKSEYEVFYNRDQIKDTFEQQQTDAFGDLVEKHKMQKHNYSNNMINIKEFAPKPVSSIQNQELHR